MSVRIETGKVQVGDDWPGVFIRGDNAFALALALRSVLDGTDQMGLMRAQCEGLYGLLMKADARNGIEPQKLEMVREDG